MVQFISKIKKRMRRHRNEYMQLQTFIPPPEFSFWVENHPPDPDCCCFSCGYYFQPRTLRLEQWVPKVGASHSLHTLTSCIRSRTDNEDFSRHFKHFIHFGVVLHRFCHPDHQRRTNHTNWITGKLSWWRVCDMQFLRVATKRNDTLNFL